LRFTKDQWKEIIRWFLLEQSSQNIAIRTSIKRLRVLRSLTIIRQALTKDVPGIFSGTVEVDETYLGGQWKNKRKIIRIRELNEGEEPRSNRYSGSSVAMALFEPRLLKMLKLILFNHSSQEKYQQALLSVLIPGKLTPGSLLEDTSIVSSITGNDSTVTEKEIILMVWKDSGDI
jgi:hypothetical protein